MAIFQIALILATFLCSLVAGLLFAFAIVVMPGIRSLKDRDFLLAFQASLPVRPRRRLAGPRNHAKRKRHLGKPPVGQVVAVRTGHSPGCADTHVP